jgi:ketosteroid isomerase-like protein
VYAYQEGEALNDKAVVHARTFLAVLVLAATSTRAPAAEPAATDPTGAVRAVLAAQVDAWNRGDLAGYMAGYWKSPDLVFFSNGHETRGWQPTLDRYRSRYQGEGKQMGTLDFPALDILPLTPDAALARGQWRLTMSNGTILTGQTSVVFRRLPEGWRIVHDHSSADCN